MALYSNLPTFTYIKWTNMMVAYEGQMYTIQNDFTNKKYVYWEKSTPYQLTCSDTKLREIGSVHLVFVNEAGIGTQMPQENLIISFDGDNKDLIAEKIFGIYQKNEEFGNKFVTIEESIDGIKQTIGEVGSEGDTIINKISKLEQDTGRIEAEVGKVEKEYNNNKETNELRENLNKSLIDINSTLGLFKSYLSDASKNTKIDATTKTEISAHLDILATRRESIILYVDKVITIMEQEGFTDKVNNLTSAKTQALDTLDNLVTIINSAISDNIFAPSEITLITDAFGKCNTRINNLKNTCDDCIYLGAGGATSEELARLSIRSDEIKLSVSKVESTSKNNLSVEISQIQVQVDDLVNALSSLKTVTTNVFADGKVTDAEKTVINEQYTALSKEKNDLVALYNKYYNNSNISEAVKSSLKRVYDDFIAKHNEVKTKLDAIVIDGFVNEVEMEQMATVYTSYENWINTFHKNLAQAWNDIETNRVNQEILNTKNELQGSIDDVGDKLNDLDTTVNTTFKDNVIDEAERKSIGMNMKTLETEKIDIDSQFTQLYANKYLTGNLKVEYKDTYDNFVIKYNTLIDFLNGILNKEELINDMDRHNMEASYDDLGMSLGMYTTVTSKVIEEVARKEAEAVKLELGQDIKDVDDKVDDLSNTMNTTFKDNVLDESERANISLNLKNLEIEKTDVDNQYNQLYANKHLAGQLKTDLKAKYDLFVSKYNSLVSVTNGILVKPTLIDDTDRENMDGAYDALNASLAGFVVVANKVIEEIAKKESEAVKALLDQDIIDVNEKIDSLDLTIDGTFANNILDQAERKDIADKLATLEKEKVDVDNQYSQLYKSPKLDGELKTRYKTTYDTYVTKYNALVAVISGILDKTDLINDTDRTNMNVANGELSTAIGVFVKVSNEVIEYIAKKEADAINSKLEQDLGSLNDKVDGILEDVEGALGDGILDDAERISIKQNLKLLANEKSNLHNQYTTLYANPNLVGSAKTQLKTAHDNYETAYNTLVAKINSILEKVENITDTDRTELDTAFANHSTKLGLFTSQLSSAVTSITDKGIEDAKGALESEISDLNGALGGLEETMNGAFKDGVLSDAEKASIRLNLKSLEAEKFDIDKSYTTVYGNSKLTGSAKTNLKTAYDDYTAKYNSLVGVINTILNKAGIIDSTDQTNLNNAFTAHKISLGEFSIKYNVAIDSITTKGISDAKSELSKEIGDVSSALGTLENTMNGAFKDGILSDAEKKAIKQNLKNLETEKLDIDKRYSTTYSNSKLVGTFKTNLKTSYDAYIVKYNALVTAVNTVVNKTGILVEADQTTLNNAFNAHNVALVDFSEKYVKAVDSIADKGIEDAKKVLQDEISDVSDAIGGLENTMNGVFKDGILSDSEKVAIKQNLQTLLNEKTNIDKQYTGLYANTDLVGNAKTNLKASYDTYITRYNALVTVINDIVNKTSIVDSADQTKLSNSFNDQRIALGVYSTRVNEAIDSIASKKARDEAETVDSKWAEIVLNPETGIQSTVGKMQQTITNNYNNLNDKIDNVQVGASNMLDGTLFKGSNLARYWTTISGWSFDNQGYTNAGRAIANGDANNYKDLRQIIHSASNTGKYLESNTEYTLSFWSYGAGTMQIHLYPELVNTSIKGIKDGTEITMVNDGMVSWTMSGSWTYHTLTFTTRGLSAGTKELYFRCPQGTGNQIRLSRVKLEKGNKATEWNMSATDILDNVDDVEVGGRNLISNGNFYKRLEKWVNEGSCDRIITQFEGYPWLQLTTTNTETYRGVSQVILNVKPNQEYTLSYRAKYGSTYPDAKNVTIGIHYRNGSTIVAQDWNYQEVTTVDGYYTWTFKVPNNTSISNFKIMLEGKKNVPFSIYYTDVKIEKGNKATDYSMSIEDSVEDLNRPNNTTNLFNTLGADKAWDWHGASTGRTVKNYKFAWSGSAGGLGIKLHARMFEVGKKYTVGFTYKKTAGSITNMGGHCQHETYDTYLDGVKQSVSYNASFNVPDDTNYHTIQFTFLAKSSSTTDMNVYIQPYRGGTAKQYTIEVSNIYVCQNEVGVSWSPSPSDLLQTIETSIDNVQVGGTNLLKNTSLKYSDDHWVFAPQATRDQDLLTPKQNVSVKISNSGQTADTWKGIYQDYSSPVVGREYIASCYVYLPTNHGIDINSRLELRGVKADGTTRTFTVHALANLTILNKWQLLVCKFTVPEDTVSLKYFPYVTRNGTMYVGDLKMEEGNKVTTWSHAPSDIDDLIDETKSSLSEIINSNTTSNNQQWEKKLQDALKGYLETGKYDEIISIVNSTVKQTEDSFNIVFNSFKGMISDTTDGLIASKEEMQTYFRFDLAGMILGRTNSPFTLRLTNEKIQFLQNGNEVAYLSNNAMVITDAYVKHSLRIGSFKWLPRSNGNLSFTWFGSVGMTGCSVDPLTLIMATNKQALVNLAFAPVDCDDKSGVWASSNTDVATVDSSGIVTAKTKGTSNITFRPNALANHITTCVVTVNKTSVEGIAIPSERTVKLGDKFSLDATWLPTGCDDKTGKWTVEDTSVVVINNNNILQNAMVGTTNNIYQILSRPIVQSQKPKNGEQYEIRFRGTLGSGKDRWGIYNSGGSVNMTLVTPSDKVGEWYVKRFPWTNTHSQYPADDSSVMFYAMPSGESVNSSIYNISIKKVADNDTTYSNRSDDTDDNRKCYFIAKKAGVTTVTFKSNDGGFISRCVIRVTE